MIAAHAPVPHMGRVLDVVTLSDSDDDDHQLPPVPSHPSPEVAIPPEESTSSPAMPDATWLTVFTAFYKVKLAEAQERDPDTDVQILFDTVSQEWQTMSGDEHQMFAKEVCGAPVSIPPSGAPDRSSPALFSVRAVQQDADPVLSSEKEDKTAKPPDKSLPCNTQCVQDVAKITESQPSVSVQQQPVISNNTGGGDECLIPTPEIQVEKETAVSQNTKPMIQKKEMCDANEDRPADVKLPVETHVSKGDQKHNSKNKKNKKDKKDTSDKNAPKKSHSEDQRSAKAEAGSALKTDLNEKANEVKRKSDIDRSACDTAKGSKEKSPHPSSSQKKEEDTIDPEIVASCDKGSPVGKCLGPGCTKDPVDNPNWDNEYCSFRCCSNYVNNCFKKWVLRRKKKMRAEAAAGSTAATAQMK